MLIELGGHDLGVQLNALKAAGQIIDCDKRVAKGNADITLG